MATMVAMAPMVWRTRNRKLPTAAMVKPAQRVMPTLAKVAPRPRATHLAAKAAMADIAPRLASRVRRALGEHQGALAQTRMDARPSSTNRVSRAVQGKLVRARRKVRLAKEETTWAAS